METDASRGGLDDVLEHIVQAKKTLKSGGLKELYSEQDAKCLDIIEQGRNEFTDLACESLLIALKANVKQMDAIKFELEAKLKAEKFT